MASAQPADPLLVDSSVAVAFCLPNHDQHGTTHAALAGRPLGLAGHAAFETYSVLTRLPVPLRLTAADAALLLSTNFPHTRHLGAPAAAGLLSELAARGLAGGVVYDALVAAAARQHDLTLATRDRRAAAVYDALGVAVLLLA